MPTGAPGDHPLSDIISWDRPMYGVDTDRLIRGIARLCSRRELYEWWEREIGWKGSPALAAENAVLYHEALTCRAKESGWELPVEDGA